MAPAYSRVCFTSNVGTVPPNRVEPLDPNYQVAHALQENARNGSLGTSFPGLDHGARGASDGPLRLATTIKKLWRSGRELKVHFKGGNDWQREKVKTYAPLWSQFANIKFNFGGDGTPDILIDFNPASGSWSVLGTDSSYPISLAQPSMNLGWIVDSKTEADIRQVVLHEFGHALGAVHEHTSPFASIPWNKEQVYKDLGGPPNLWDRETVDRNMFTVYSSEDVSATAFDPESVMLYQYPPCWTLDNKGTPNNTVLSNLDKAYIAFCYPSDEYDAGQFNTQKIQSRTLPTLTIESVEYFHSKFSTPPALAYGLNWLDIDCRTNIRVKALVKNIQSDFFTAVFDSCGDTKLYAAGMTWLEVARFPFLQTGFFNTDEVRPWNLPRAKTSKRFDFQNAFSAPPKVVCFFTSLDISNKHNYCAKVFPSDIDRNGFTINISTWSDTILYSGEATWLAYPSDQPKVTAGRFSTKDILGRKALQAENSGFNKWDLQFDKIPKVFMALDELDYGRGDTLKWRLSTSNVTSTGISWTLQSWGGSPMNQSGASYFAWENPEKSSS